MSSDRRELAFLVASRIFAVTGVFLAIVMPYLCHRHFANSTVVDICGGLDVTGAAIWDAATALPSVRLSLFPPGFECSLYAGEGVPRVTGFTDDGLTSAFAPPLVLIAIAAVLKVVAVRQST